MKCNYKEELKSIDISDKSVEEIREMLGGTKIHAVAVQKGGTGKTTTSSDIAYTLAKRGFRVLLIDSDPQASLTMLCNVDANDDNIEGLQDIYADALQNKGLVNLDKVRHIWENQKPFFVKPVRKNGKYVNEKVPFGFDLIPANINLADLDIHLSNFSRGGLLMYQLVNQIANEGKYDFILTDSCPGLSSIAYNTVAASISGVIVPVTLEPMCVKGAQNLINITTEIQHLIYDNFGINHKGIVGIIKNQYTPRLNIQKRFSNIVETFFPIPCFETSIPSKTSCDTAHDLGRLYSEYDPKVGKIFDELVDELIKIDILRNQEKEPVFVEEFGEEIWNMINANKDGDNNGII